MLSLQCAGAFVAVSSLFGLVAWSQTPTPVRDQDLVRGSWTAQVGEEIRASEYHWAPVRYEEGVWCAANRSQELCSRVSSAGIEIFPRETGAEEAGAAWKLGLRTRSFGRQASPEVVSRGVLCVDGTRAELARGRSEERRVGKECRL